MTHRGLQLHVFKLNMVLIHFVLNIFLGFCAEFDRGGALIQDNYQAECRNYDPPCPNIYDSAEAYKCELKFQETNNKLYMTFIQSYIVLRFLETRKRI